MGLIIPVAGAIQWISGLILGFVALRRGGQYGAAGRWARLFAVLAIICFIAAALEIVLSTRPFRGIVSSVLPANFTGDEWQFRTLLYLCGAAWLFLMISGIWNGILGVGLRRRAAAAELRRRTERVISGNQGRVER